MVRGGIRTADPVHDRTPAVGFGKMLRTEPPLVERMTGPWLTDDLLVAIERELVRLDELREETIRRGRGLVRVASMFIAEAHRGRADGIDRVRKEGRELAGLVRDAGHPAVSSAAAGPLAEWVEAELVYALASDSPPPRPDDLGVPADLYVSALGDLVGECRRMALDAASAGDWERAREMVERMQELFDLLSRLDFPSRLGGVRHKRDVARALLDRTRGEVLLSSRLRVGPQAPGGVVLTGHGAPPEERGGRGDG